MGLRGLISGSPSPREVAFTSANLTSPSDHVILCRDLFQELTAGSAESGIFYELSCYFLFFNQAWDRLEWSNGAILASCSIPSINAFPVKKINK
jgi:hypothetical protein